METIRYTKAAIALDDGGTWLKLQVHPADIWKARKCVLNQRECVYSAELKEFREKRSLDANAYFHVLVGKIAEATGIGFEEIKTNLVTEYGVVDRGEDGAKIGFMLPASVKVEKVYRYVKEFDTRTVNGVVFNCYLAFKHTHLMDTKEMARLIDGAVSEARNLGIETLPPDKLALLKEDWKSG